MEKGTMPNESNCLTIDWTQKDVSSKLFPNSSLLTSYEAGWENIALEHHLVRSVWETPNIQYAQHTIVIHLNSKTNLERKLGDRLHDYDMLTGDTALIPANVTHYAVNKEECEGLFLALDPQFVSQIAYETVDPDSIELVPTFIQSDPLIYNLGLALQSELKSDRFGCRPYVDSLTTALAAHIVRKYSTRQLKLPHYSGGLSRYSLRQALNYINDNLHQDLKIANISELLGMSPYYFCRLFTQSMGISPHQYITQCRLERAKLLLKKTNLSIIEITAEVGFSSQSHFITLFKKQLGTTPLQYKKDFKG
jgi:AraC family transcriptional regulator